MDSDTDMKSRQKNDVRRPFLQSHEEESFTCYSVFEVLYWWLTFCADWFNNVLWHLPVGDEAEEDVAKEAANVEEGGGDVRPLGVVAHQVKLSHQCVCIL